MEGKNFELEKNDYWFQCCNLHIRVMYADKLRQIWIGLAKKVLDRASEAGTGSNFTLCLSTNES
jgi:hypothetical protein